MEKDLIINEAQKYGLRICSNYTKSLTFSNGDFGFRISIDENGLYSLDFGPDIPNGISWCLDNLQLQEALNAVSMIGSWMQNFEELRKNLNPRAIFWG